MSFTFDLKKLLENAFRFVTDVVLNILPCSADFNAWTGRTHNAGSVMRIAFKHKFTGFQINFFKNDLSVHYFVLVHS